MKNLKEEIERMKVSEIVQAMVDSLRNPVTEIDMSSYGYVYDGVCFGCAATNTILKIADTKPSTKQWGIEDRAIKLKINSAYIYDFELAINYLRLGGFDSFVFMLESIKEISHENKIKIYSFNGFNLPELEDNYTQEELGFYQELANKLKTAGL